MIRSKPLILFTFLLLILVMLTGCDPAVRSRPVPEEAKEVRTGRAHAESIQEQIEVPGTVHSRTRAQISARIMAQIERVAVDQGDRVSRGDLLFELDDRQLRAGVDKIAAARRELEMVRSETEAAIRSARSQLAQAEANLTLAESTMARFEQLISKEAVSPQEFDEVRAKRDSSRAAVEAARGQVDSLVAREAQLDSRSDQIAADLLQAVTQLEFSMIRAPFSGVVLERQADVGTLASPGRPLLTLENREYRLEVPVEETLLGLVELGQEIEVKISHIGEPLLGRIAQIAPGADPQTRTVLLKIDLPDHGALRSGVFGRALFPAATQDVLTVSESAIVRQGQIEGVFLVQDARAIFRVLRFGRALGGRRVVTSGLSAEDQVILNPSSEIRDGTPIRVSASQRGAS